MATLQELREKRKLTQVELAERTGLSISTIAWLEAGRTRPNFSTFQALRKALGPEVEQVDFRITQGRRPRQEQEQERASLCKCGQPLSNRVYFDTAVWALDMADYEAYKAHKQPAHDVIAGNGRRLRIGACELPPAECEHCGAVVPLGARLCDHCARLD